MNQRGVGDEKGELSSCLVCLCLNAALTCVCVCVCAFAFAFAFVFACAYVSVLVYIFFVCMRVCGARARLYPGRTEVSGE